jgi:hypothetical protein
MMRRSRDGLRISGKKRVMKNMGIVDRLIRVTIAVAIAIAYFTGAISGTLAIILGVIAIAFVLTSLDSTCPGYMPFGISTRHRNT